MSVGTTRNVSGNDTTMSVRRHQMSVVPRRWSAGPEPLAPALVIRAPKRPAAAATLTSPRRYRAAKASRSPAVVAVRLLGKGLGPAAASAAGLPSSPRSRPGWPGRGMRPGTLPWPSSPGRWESAAAPSTGHSSRCPDPPLFCCCPGRSPSRPEAGPGRWLTGPKAERRSLPVPGGRSPKLDAIRLVL